MAAQREELEMAPDAAKAWPDRIYDLLKQHGVRQVALVPDAGHSRLIRRCLADNGMRVVTLTTEEEGIAVLGIILAAYESSRTGSAAEVLSV